MRNWVRALISRGALELALALALGYAVFLLIYDLAQIPIDAIAQHVNEEDEVFEIGGYASHLNFRVGNTFVIYGPLVVAGLAALALALVALLVRRQRDHTLGRCPYCLTQIAPNAEVCAACTREVLPAE